MNLATAANRRKIVSPRRGGYRPKARSWRLSSSTPVHERVAKLAADGCFPGGLTNNREYLGDYVSVDGASSGEALPLFDPQTSGGLLVSVAGIGGRRS